MQKYDAMYIIRPDFEEEARKNLIAEISKIFSDRGAASVQVREWGSRKLAYEIEDFKEGYYVDMEVETENVESLAEYDRVCNIKEAILRHIVVKLPAKK
ncbi:30S ribosomal protein S6 [bacterium]|nr:30S ribosomal protein S6 [bacterium]